MPPLGETDLLCSPLPPLVISNGGWFESCRGKHDFPIKQWGLEMFPFSAAALLLQNHFCHNTYTIYAMDQQTNSLQTYSPRTISTRTDSPADKFPLDKFPDQCSGGQIPGSVSEQTNSPQTNSRISVGADKFPDNCLLVKKKNFVKNNCQVKKFFVQQKY